MKIRLIVAVLACVAAPSVAMAIPPEFAVCVTTSDADGRMRLDSYYDTAGSARVRVAIIRENGWITTGDESDREDYYPVTSIVKVTIDPTLINRHSCLPAPTPPVVVGDQRLAFR